MLSGRPTWLAPSEGEVSPPAGVARTGRRNSGLSTGRGKPSRVKPAPPDGEPLLTSNDLFGDLVDAPLPPQREQAQRTTPIRIQLSDKSQARQVGRLVGPEAAAEIEDVLARLDGATPPEPPVPAARHERAGEQTDPHLVVEAFLPPETDVDLA